MVENVLVTGASGFVGKNLVRALRQKGYNVAELNRRAGDISNQRLDFKNIGYVFHLAARTFVPDSWENPFEFYSVNVTGTANVLEFCRRSGCGLTFLSAYVYGQPEKLPIGEGHPLRPNNPYCHSKLLAEEICRFYTDYYNLPVTILRPFNIYGPGQSEVFLIPSIVRQVFDGSVKEITVKDLRPRRDYLYVDDLVEAMLLAMYNNKPGVYNIGYGRSASVEEIINEVADIAGMKKKYVSENKGRKNEIMDTVADISKIHRELNWKPAHSLREGLEKTMDEMRGSQ